MFKQVKSAAGIHMSTFKDKENAGEDRLPEDTADISGWTPPAHLYEQFRRSGMVGDA